MAERDIIKIAQYAQEQGVETITESCESTHTIQHIYKPQDTVKNVLQHLHLKKTISTRSSWRGKYLNGREWSRRSVRMQELWRIVQQVCPAPHVCVPSRHGDHSEARPRASEATPIALPVPKLHKSWNTNARPKYNPGSSSSAIFWNTKVMQWWILNGQYFKD